jgi:hypothetical protein
VNARTKAAGRDFIPRAYARGIGFVGLNELSKSHGSIKNGSIRLDGHEDRAYKRAATTYFRQQADPRGGVIKDMKFVNSKNDSLIQLADMVAGAIMRTTQGNKTDSKDYLNTVKKRIEDIWSFK